jgi:uncharacterized protein YfkK (UPF0435 family)
MTVLIKRGKGEEWIKVKFHRTYFFIDDLIFKLEKPEITLKKICVTQGQIENEEYKELRKEFDEEIFNIVKNRDGWLITEKD